MTKIFAFLTLYSLAVLGATITQKSVGCEVNENVERAYYLLEHNGSKGFIKFMTLNQCQILFQGAKIDILEEDDAYSKITPVNLRELWVRKEVVAK